MKIIGYLEHPSMKITAFKMNHRITLKFETTQFEQTFKLPETEGLETFADVQRLVDAEFLERMLEGFQQMNRVKNEALGRGKEGVEEVFEEII